MEKNNYPRVLLEARFFCLSPADIHYCSCSRSLRETEDAALEEESPAIGISLKFLFFGAPDRKNVPANAFFFEGDTVVLCQALNFRVQSSTKNWRLGSIDQGV